MKTFRNSYTDSIMNFPLLRQKNSRFTQSIGGNDEKYKLKAVQICFIAIIRLDIKRLPIYKINRQRK